VSLQRLLVLEDFDGGVVAEVFLEEAEDARLFGVSVIQQPLDLSPHLLAGRELVIGNGLEERLVRHAVREGERDRPGHVVGRVNDGLRAMLKEISRMPHVLKPK